MVKKTEQKTPATKVAPQKKVNTTTKTPKTTAPETPLAKSTPKPKTPPKVQTDSDIAPCDKFPCNKSPPPPPKTDLKKQLELEDLEDEITPVNELKIIDQSESTTPVANQKSPTPEPTKPPTPEPVSTNQKAPTPEPVSTNQKTPEPMTNQTQESPPINGDGKNAAFESSVDFTNLNLKKGIIIKHSILTYD